MLIEGEAVMLLWWSLVSGIIVITCQNDLIGKCVMHRSVKGAASENCGTGLLCCDSSFET